MIGRLAVCALLAAQVVPAFAAKDEVEYLIPEDWNSKKDEAKPATDFEGTWVWNEEEIQGGSAVFRRCVW